MSKRRQIGGWVALLPNSGFVGESDRLRAEIRPEPDEGWSPCLLSCGDDDCREWVTLWTEPDPLHAGRRHTLCHVSECQMLDREAPAQDQAPGAGSEPT